MARSPTQTESRKADPPKRVETPKRAHAVSPTGPEQAGPVESMAADARAAAPKPGEKAKPPKPRPAAPGAGGEPGGAGPDAPPGGDGAPGKAPPESKGERDGATAERGKEGEEAPAEEKAGAAAPAAGAGPKGGKPAAPVELLMPEAPKDLSAADHGRIDSARKGMTAGAAAHAKMPPAGDQVRAASNAAEEPPQETAGKAAMKLAQEIGGPEPPSFEIEQFIKTIEEEIRNRRPRSESDMTDPLVSAKETGQKLDQSVSGRATAMQEQYDRINQPPPPGTPTPPLGEPPTAVGPARPPVVNAPAAAPQPIPPKNVSLDADAAAARESAQKAGMNKPTAQLVQSGPIAEAREAQGELDEAAKKTPAEILATQQAALEKARGDMGNFQMAAVNALAAARRNTATNAHGRQKNFITSEEQLRDKLSGQAQTIVKETRDLVAPLLARLTKEPLANWNAGLETASLLFKQDLAAVEEARKDAYGDGFFGSLFQAFDRLVDWFADNKFWLDAQFEKAEKNFINYIRRLLVQISTVVNGIVKACKQIILAGHEKLDNLYKKDIPPHLIKAAEAEKLKFTEMLNGLTTEVEDARNNFNKDLVNRARDAVFEVHDQVEAAREAAKGIIGRIARAIGEFIDDPARFIINGLLELVGIPPADFWALVAKIEQVISDIADDPIGFANNLMEGVAKGFEQFFENFGEHVLQGLLDWLFSGLKGVGIELPKDFSLKSVITFFLQLMGITWKRVREILVKHVGEKNVALVERVWALVQPLFALGPAGIYDLLKEQLNPQNLLDMVLEMAKDYLISALIKQITARIIALFNPVGAIFVALEAIYRVLKWVFKNAARIFRLIEAVVNGIAAIIAGDIGAVANLVENALAMLIPPVIDFLADYLGLGDLPEAVAEAIGKMQDQVYVMMDKVIGFLVEKGKQLLAAAGIGGKEDKKAGKYDGEVGKTVQFTAGGETHKVWVAVAGNNVEVMIASAPIPVADYLKEFGVKANRLAASRDMKEKARGNEAKPLIAEAQAIVAEVAAKAAETLAATAQEQADPAAVTAKDDATESAEQRLVSKLKEIAKALGVKPPVAPPVNPGDRLFIRLTRWSYATVEGIVRGSEVSESAAGQLLVSCSVGYGKVMIDASVLADELAGTGEQYRRASNPPPEVVAILNDPLMNVGPNARPGGYVVTTSPDTTDAQRRAIQPLGAAYGCHQNGPPPGPGQVWWADHQPPTVLIDLGLRTRPAVWTLYPQSPAYGPAQGQLAITLLGIIERI